MPSLREVESLPPLYRNLDQFIALTESTTLRDSGGLEYIVADGALKSLIADLMLEPPNVTNFALFAYRGFYYQELAHLMSASYMPHSWRSGLIKSQLETPTTLFADLVIEESGKVRQALGEQISHEFGSAILASEFPLIASFVISQAAKRSDLLRVAVEIRASSKAAAFRNWIYEIERKIREEKDLVGIRQAQDELTTVVHELERELGLSKAVKQEVKIKLGVPMASVELNRGFTGALPVWIRRITRRRTHLVFLRELIHESTRIAPFALQFRQLAP